MATIKKVNDKTEKKLTTKKTTDKKGKKSTEKKGAGLMTPMLVSESLQKVIKKKSCSRAESMKYTWEYIKKNKLQSEKDKRTIIPDNILAEVTGKTPFGMMQLAGKIFKHLS